MTDAVLEIDRITKRQRTVVLLHEVSLTARAGELVGLVGGAESGKTTTLRIAAGVLAADTGRVRWCSAPIDPATRRRIGYLPATGGLHQRMTVLDQLVYRAELHGLSTNTAHRDTQAWLDRFGLRGLRSSRIDSLTADTQRQLALIATLLAGPALLLLDEPFAGVGPTSLRIMVDVLREQAQAGVAVLLSGNDIGQAEQVCDRLSILYGGQTIAEGTPVELRGRGPRLLAVDVPTGTPGWAGNLAGCRIVDVDGSRTLLELDAGTDDQDVLHAALATGPVREFTLIRRSLADLYGNARSYGTTADAGQPR